jgi:Right handed beta helix region
MASMIACRSTTAADAIRYILRIAFPAAMFAAVSCCACSGSAQTVVSSLAELRAHANDNNVNIVMAPGEYWINKNGSDTTLLRLSGNNTLYDFSQATFKVDTRNFAGFGGGGANDVSAIGMYGTASTVQGLNLSGVDVDVDLFPNAQRWANAATNLFRISGSNNTLRDASIITAGSTPFGFGDVFGKGGNPGGGLPFINHHKASGVQIWESNGATIDNLYLEMNSFGHGIYMQKAAGLNTILNSHIIGQLVSSDEIIASPEYQATITAEFPQGRTTYGPPLPPGIMISKSEDAIRTYGVVDGVGVGPVIVDNTIVENMRSAFQMFDAPNPVTVTNSEAWNNETGFEPSTNSSYTNVRGNATNGPLVLYHAAGINNSYINVELVRDQPQPGINWDIVYLSGNDNEVIVTSPDDPNELSPNSVFRNAQRFNDWRHAQSPDIDNGHAGLNNSIMNLSGQDMVIGTPGMTGSNNYDIANGKYLGGNGMVITSPQGSDVDLRIQAGGKLDPVGTLTISVGLGDLELAPGINATNSHALLFHLDTVTNSDKVVMDTRSRLNIGTSALTFDDFLFSTGPSFVGGVFTLFESSVPIFGTLGENVTGIVAGSDAALSLSGDGMSILLTVDAPPVIAGDYNGDGVVDAADYTLWRDNLGGTGLLNETVTLGVVDQEDYQVWKANFGFGSSAGSAAREGAIPEPDTWVLIACPLLLFANAMRGRTDESPAQINNFNISRADC